MGATAAGAALMLAGTSSAASAARVSLGPVDGSPAPIARSAVSDLIRYVAYRTVGGMLVIRDTRTGRSRQAPLGRLCYPADLHAGRVLIDCLSDRSVPGQVVLLGDAGTVDVQTRRARTFFTAPAAESYPPLLSIGRYWAGAGCVQGEPGPDCVSLYNNLRTGARRRLFGVPLGDLDSPTLARVRSRPETFPRLELRGNTEYVRVSRTRRVRLCTGACSSVQLSAGLVTWVTGRQVRALRLRDQHRYRWTFPTPYTSALHTADEIIVSSAQLGGAVRLFAIAAP